MYSEEYYKLIQQLRLHSREEEASFGIYQYGSGMDECYIKANKEGLRLYALALLIAAQKTEEQMEDSEKQIIPISYLVNWIDQNSQVFLQYIDPIREQPVVPFTEATNSIEERLTTTGCLLLIIFILLAVVVGTVSILKWIF